MLSETKIKYLAVDKENLTHAQLTAMCELIDTCNANYFSLPRAVQDRLEDVLDAIQVRTLEPTSSDIVERALLARSTFIDTGD